jgi:hypothetical protein
MGDVDGDVQMTQDMEEKMIIRANCPDVIGWLKQHNARRMPKLTLHDKWALFKAGVKALVRNDDSDVLQDLKHCFPCTIQQLLQFRHQQIARNNQNTVVDFFKLEFSESGSDPFQEFLSNLKFSEDIARDKFLKWFSNLPSSSVESISDIRLPENPKVQDLRNWLESNLIDLPQSDFVEFCSLLIPQARMSLLGRSSHFVCRLGTSCVFRSFI